MLHRCLLSGSIFVDALEFNQYIDDCCRSLEDANEYPTDAVLTHMCRLQRIADSVVRAFPRPEAPTKPGVPKVPTYLALKALQSELYSFKDKLPEPLKENHMLQFNYYATEVILYETILIDTPSSPTPMDKLQVLEMLNNCLVAIKAFFELYRILPQAHYAYLPFTVWIHSGMVLQVACELAFFEFAGWDLPTVRREMDIPSMLDFELRGLNEVLAIRGTVEQGQEHRDIFNRFRKRKQNMKSAYEARLAAETATTQQNDMPMPPAPQIPSVEDMYMGGLYYDFDNTFWQDFGIASNNWAGVSLATPPQPQYQA